MAWLADDCTTGQIQWHKHTFDGIEGHRGENLSHTTDGASSDVLECLELVRHHLLANSWLCHPARCPRTRSDKLRRNKSCAEQSGCVEGTRVTRSVRHATRFTAIEFCWTEACASLICATIPMCLSPCISPCIFCDASRTRIRPEASTTRSVPLSTTMSYLVAATLLLLAVGAHAGGVRVDPASQHLVDDSGRVRVFHGVNVGPFMPLGAVAWTRCSTDSCGAHTMQYTRSHRTTLNRSRSTSLTRYDIRGRGTSLGRVFTGGVHCSSARRT